MLQGSDFDSIASIPGAGTRKIPVSCKANVREVKIHEYNHPG